MVSRPDLPLVAVPAAATSGGGKCAIVVADARRRVRGRERLWREVALYLEFVAIARAAS